MASVINFTSLQHAEDYYCSIIEIDQVKVLLNCGISSLFLQNHLLEKFTESSPRLSIELDYITYIRETANSISAVLISGSDLAFIGALPLIIDLLPVNCPILSTVPVFSLAQISLAEIFKSMSINFGFEDTISKLNLAYIEAPFSSTCIKKVLDRFTPLRYSQKFHLVHESGNEIILSPLSSGCSLGGSLWRIQNPPIDDIVYAAHFSHRRSEITEGADLVSGFQRPTLFICDARRALSSSTSRFDRKSRIICTLKDAMSNSLSSNANVLICVDSLTRLIELIFILKTNEFENSFKSLLSRFRLYALGYSINELFEIAKGLVEWSNSSISDYFESSKINPFDFSSFVHGIERFEDNSESLKLSLIFSYAPNLMVSPFYKNFYENFISKPQNTIIYTSDYISNVSYEKEMFLNTYVKRTRENLSGEELDSFNERQNIAKRTLSAKELLSNLNDSAGNSGDIENDHADFFKNRIKTSQNLCSLLWADFDQDLSLVKSNPQKYIYPLFTIGIDIISKLFKDDYGLKYNAPVLIKEISEPMNISTNVSFLESNINSTPYKWSSELRKVDILCSIRTVDFASFSDIKSVLNLVELLAPRKIIFFGGSCDDLDYYRNSLSFSSKFSPEAVSFANFSEKVNASISLNVCQIPIEEPCSIGSTALRNLNDYKVGFFKVARVSNSLKILKSNINGSDYLVIGYIRFSDLRSALLRNLQLDTDEISLVSGQLNVADKICLKRFKSDDFSLEAEYSDTLVSFRNSLMTNLADFIM